MFTYNCQEPIFFKEPLFSSNTKNKFRIIHNNTNSQTKEPSQTIILSDQKNKIFTKAAEIINNNNSVKKTIISIGEKMIKDVEKRVKKMVEFIVNKNSSIKKILKSENFNNFTTNIIEDHGKVVVKCENYAEFTETLEKTFKLYFSEPETPIFTPKTKVIEKSNDFSVNKKSFSNENITVDKEKLKINEL